MNYVNLTPEQQREVCEALIDIEQGGLLSRLAVVRQQMLREMCPASPGEEVEIELLAKRASSLIGGSRGYWREAAAAALGIPTVSDVCIEAVAIVAEDAQRRREPQREEPRLAAPRHRATLGSRKRGGR